MNFTTLKIMQQRNVRGSIMNVFRHTAIVKRVLLLVNIW